jgi:class 3 adenylate cyclase/tetratricopeptide (TPR) repeat protein
MSAGETCMADDLKLWLDSLDLAKYREVFAENEVTFGDLPELTEDDLKEMGLPIGPRRRVLKAIAALDRLAEASRPLEDEETSEHASPDRRAERRQLTVMFCDLVGSTELSHRLDPEDLRDVMRCYQDAVAGVVVRYQGYVAKFLGDGVLAYFGWPQAQEDQAERAVRAGLDCVAAVAALRLEDDLVLQVRAGIATGQVVVGDLVGEAAAEAQAIAGETPNLAARLQGKAAANQVVIATLTRELVGETFDLEHLGAWELKGFPDPVPIWRVVREGSIRSRYEAKRRGRASPLVGRQEEMGLLLRSWETSKQGHGQVVLIQGEAGIGKSRLIEALRDRVSKETYVWVAHRCSPYHANSTLYPVIEHLKRAMGWKPEDSAAERLEKLETGLKKQSLPLEEVVPLYAELMSLPLPEARFAASTISAKQKRERTLDALAGWLLEAAETTPVLNVWEDLHWADPTTLELLSLYIEQSPTVAMLNVLTYRPDFSPPWAPRSHMTPITLNRLERTEVEALIAQQAHGKRVPAEVIDHIVGKADGVPLYVEELSKTILHSDYLREDAERYVLAGSLAEISIPATLQDTLMARLDRLPRVRALVQLGAVLGREFAYEMLQALAPLEEPELQGGLGELVENELLYQRGRPPRARYIFKHALIQDAAYQSLLKRTRQEYHRQVAILLLERFPETVAAHPELVAHHYCEGGCIEEAVTYLRKAGEVALAVSANAEAVTHFSRALELIKELPETPARAASELGMVLALGPALVAAQGFPDPRVGQTYDLAWELCKNTGDNSNLPLVLRGRQLHELVQGDVCKAREIAQELFDLAEIEGDPALIIGGHHALAQSNCYRGDLIAAREHAEAGIAAYDPKAHSFSNWPGGHPGTQCYIWGALATWLLGFPDQSRRLAEAAISLAAEEVGQPFNLANTLAQAALVHVFCREPSIAQVQIERCMEICIEQGIPLWLAHGSVVHGWALETQGLDGNGIAELNEGLAGLRAIGMKVCSPPLLVLRAEVYYKRAQVGEALTSLNEAATIMESNGERWWEAELIRLRGEIALRQGNDRQVEAEGAFQTALEVARRQHSKSLELRAALSLSRLWRTQDKTAAARDLISPLYGWFAEGFDTADLRDAKEQLDRVS